MSMDHLTPAQQGVLNDKKIELRLKNEQYLRAHPELAQMTSLFLTRVLEDKPGSVLAFATDFFSDPALRTKVEATATATGTGGKK